MTIYAPAIGNKVVAHHMRQNLSRNLINFGELDEIAMAYGDACHSIVRDMQVADAPQLSVALGVNDDNLEYVAKRSALVTEALLLSTNVDGETHQVSKVKRGAWIRNRDTHGVDARFLPHPDVDARFIRHPDFSQLGRWARDSAPITREGLVCYMPPLYDSGRHLFSGTRGIGNHEPKRIDAPIASDQVIDHSGTAPLSNQWIRPVLKVNLPFVDGVDVADFSRITINELNSYKGFRNYLHRVFLDLDEAMNAEQTDRALRKIGLEIEDQVRLVQSQVGALRRKRAVAATGAVLGISSAILVAVYGPALKEVLAILGAQGGIWGGIHAFASENSKKSLRDGKWYYAWALSRKAQCL